MNPVGPYTVLAHVYDYVMRGVPYELWAAYIVGILERYAPEARRLVEFGCGTGSLALALEAYGYEVWGVDASAAMLSVARAKAQVWGSQVRWVQADVRKLSGRALPKADVALMLHDGLNYLLTTEELARALRNMARCLWPGGVLLFDVSTPENSRRHAHELDEVVQNPDFTYRRLNTFESEKRLHRTRFEIYYEGSWWVEEHLERAYTQDEIDAVLGRLPELTLLERWEEFTHSSPGPDAERLLYVARRTP
ncbi:MAG: class I SAM-dependent methyltransferase [Bacteroidetes bacterium]|nr:class I SAM-dependent methyltransferase [Rhodothermia bacterium]MCS7155699.1 class I SAM-dependent methyltransferase [Bacteroidota bacterium]MCX7906558.1 class I SAM-dependent methyltransferase [Bacteroidota bacterium]MDW8137161.1 class I SAM-dependent methyltransferase [Bacteroidota bacterium]MDW8284969.1 class I SAM-dependent methyltransferase [Bacteroidota bacterium]